MVGIAERPLMIESPRVTASDVTWESYEELAGFLEGHAPPGSEPAIFKNDRGEWVRWWIVDDPETKRVNPETGAVESRQVYVHRRVALTQAEAMKPGNDWDFVLPAEPGSTIYGQPYVWMHGGRKPEVDPGLWYAREHAPAPSAAREGWRTLPSSQAAEFLVEQKKVHDAAALQDIVAASIEAQAPPDGRKGR